MKIRYVLPQETQAKIDKIDEKLAKIELAYAERIKEIPFMEEQIWKDFMSNPSVLYLQKVKCDIYKTSAEQIEVEFESDKEMEECKRAFRIKETIRNFKRDAECKYRDLCEEMYGNENFICEGLDSCEHYDAYLEGECVALESE